MKYLKIIIFFISVCSIAQKGKVIGIKDGDTIIVLDDNNTQTVIRLAEVDCPESSQPFGKNAKHFTSAEVYLKMITYKVLSVDRYGRTIAQVFYDNKYLSEEIIKNGFGWHYTKYSTSEKLSQLQMMAKRNNSGLWCNKMAIAPWNWRHNVH